MIENIKTETIETMLDTLPVEISFVDKNDEVKYFNKNGDRIFPRPRGIIGRKVQQCHPKKSVHIVNKILEDFKNKKRKVAEFWINLKGRKIYIRYFPVWDKEGNYLGCLEVSQDITDVQKITGERRLLDETK
jgi:PAS domain S-box-containing protein